MMMPYLWATAVAGTVVWVTGRPASRKPWLGRRLGILHRLAKNNSRSDGGENSWRSDQVVVMATASALGIIGFVIFSQTLVVVAALLALVAPPQLSKMRDARSRESALDELPNLVDLLVSEIRSGASVSEGLAKLDEVIDLDGARQLVAPFTRLLRAGIPLTESLGLLTVSPDPSLRLLGAGLGVLISSGGPAVPALQHIRHTLMGSVHARAETRVQGSQARASASVLSLAPIVFAGLASAADSRLGSFYLFEWWGTICVTSSAGLAAVGWRWMMSLADNCEQVS